MTDDVRFLGQARARYGDHMNPAELLRAHHETITIGRARDEYRRALDRALAAYDAATAHAFRWLTVERERLNADTIAMCEPARRAFMYDLEELAHQLRSGGFENDDAYHEAMSQARRRYDLAVAPIHKAHDEATAKMYAAHDAAIAQAKAIYDDASAYARAQYDAATTHYGHDAGDHSECSPFYCSHAAAKSI